MATKLTTANFAPSILSAIVGPAISSVQIANGNTYATIVDDTAVPLAGGYIVLNGTGFVTGCQVYLDSTIATTVTFVSSTRINVQVPALAAGTYVLYLVNGDGSIAIRVNGLTYSISPTWSTASDLGSSAFGTAISLQLAAPSDSTIVYTLAAGSSLPTGLILSSAGLLSGTVTIESTTTYNFSIVATDVELQESPRTFSISIILGDTYFNSTTLLLTGDGTNNANNNVFIDSSTNAVALTRTGTMTQGSFTPFSPSGWSVNFNRGTLTTTLTGKAAGTGSVTYELFFYSSLRDAAVSAQSALFNSRGAGTGGDGIDCTVLSTGEIKITTSALILFQSAANLSITDNWYHLAVVRNGTTNWTVYLNGVSIGTFSSAINLSSVNLYLGTVSSPTFDWLKGYISNFRYTRAAVYTSNFTPPTAPLTVIADTEFLSCLTNQFKDISANNFAITPAAVNGTSPSIQPFAPFKPSAAYSAAVHGGSVYKIRTDYLTASTSASLITFTGDFTLEAWVYPTVTAAGDWGLIDARNSGGAAQNWVWTLTGYSNGFLMKFYTAGVDRNNATRIPAYAWTHVAAVRTGTTLKYYINGIVDANTFSLSGTISGAASGDVFLLNTKDYTVSAAWGSEGYITDLRVVNGTGVYTTNFTPPTAPLTAITNTTLLLSSTNAGIVDASGRNDLGTVGDAKISTAVKKYGTGSMVFDGTGDYVTCPTSVAAFGSSSFTVEAWVWFTSNTAGYQPICSNYGSGDGQGWILITESNNTLTAYFSTGGSWTYTLTSSYIPTINVWTHIAVVRNGTTGTLYANGVSVGTVSMSTGTLAVVAGPFSIGYYPYFPGGARSFNGYIDDFRITKGVARYTANFTAPTSALITR